MSENSWCPVARLSGIIGDNWSLMILRELAFCPQRFKALKENIVGISMDQLTRKLQQLQSEGLIDRHEFAEVPPRVEYRLTSIGISFIPVLRRMVQWSSQFIWGNPGDDEICDHSLQLKLIARFWGEGSGIAFVTIVRLDMAENFRVERREDGTTLVSRVGDVPVFSSNAAVSWVEIQELNWMKLAGKMDARVSARMRGNLSALKRILPIFTRAENSESHSHTKFKEVSLTL